MAARGGSIEELAHEQGRLTAQVSTDRLLEGLAHVGSTTGTPWDELARRMLLARTAERSFDRLDDETAAFVTAYSQGVRAGADELAAWRDWTPLGVLAIQHALFGSLGHHLWRRHVRRTMGADAVATFAGEVPALSGSNAWVVGGARTASGRPMIGADPHRILTVPGVYQRVHLVAADEDVDVVGLTFPGVPGVQHFAHTGTVAWAITNAMADTQDVTEVGPDDVLGTVDGVPVTAAGPLVLEGADGAGLAVRTVPWLLDDLGFAALLPLLRARSVVDVDAALDHWVDPVNEVLVADVDGAVLHRVAGKVPWREPGSREWTGWVVPHRRAVPPDGHQVLANQRQGQHSAALADEMAPPHRARRLEQLLGQRAMIDVEWGAALHTDTLLLTATAWQERLASLDLHGPGPTPADSTAAGQVAELRDRLVAWDGRMDADSVDATVFAALRAATVRLLVAHPALAGLSTPSSDPWTGPAELFAPWLRPEPRVAAALDRWLETPGGGAGPWAADNTAGGSGPWAADGAAGGAGPWAAEGTAGGAGLWAEEDPPVDLDAILVRALAETAPLLGVPAPWGTVHTFTPFDGPTVRLGGDEGCVLSTSSLPGLDDRVWRGPVARVVWCLADRSASRWTVPDELDVWASGSTSPLEIP